ncbi:uncharacterized protein LOC143195635 isoform X2 [Rhynchophorus ferrugineus]|uniref:uncharacterized protein LOC143195635 isoform X2 n=1 Tax=Rhynchophorus ferrugineus TaxID=354439 RepID=UPI003FCE6AE5
MEKMELIKPGIYKKSVRGQKFNNTIKNTFQNLQERIENLKEIKPTGKMLKEKTLQPKLRKSMLLRAFKSSEKNIISSTPYHKNNQQFFENTSSVPISPINVGGEAHDSSNNSSNEINSNEHKSNDNECLPQNGSSLIYENEEALGKVSASSIRRSRRDITPNRRKNSIQKEALPCLQQSPSPKQNTTCHRSRIQVSPVKELHNSFEQYQLKQNKTSKIPVRKKTPEPPSMINLTMPNLFVKRDLAEMNRSVSLCSMSDTEEAMGTVMKKNPHKCSDENPEDEMAGLLEDIHKSFRSTNCTAKLLIHRNQTVNSSEDNAGHEKDRSTMVEANCPKEKSLDEDCNIYVNKTPGIRRREDIYRTSEVEHDKNDARRAFENFARSVGLSPIAIPTAESPKTPQRQHIQQNSYSKTGPRSRSVADKRDMLHKTVEKIQSTRSTQVTPHKSHSKMTPRHRQYLKLSAANTFAEVTEGSNGNKDNMSPTSLVSEGSTGMATRVLHNAYNSNCRNIYDSLSEGDDFLLDFSDIESLPFSPSALTKPWRISMDVASKNCDSIKLNFIRSENQITSSQLDDFSDSDFEDITLTRNTLSKSTMPKKDRVTIMQTGKRQYNKKKRKSRLALSKSRISLPRRKSKTRMSLKKNTKELMSNESGLDTDTAAVSLNKQLFPKTTERVNSNLNDTEEASISLSVTDKNLLGVKLLELKKANNAASQNAKIKESSKNNVNTDFEQLKNKELLIVMQNEDLNSKKQALHHLPLSPEMSSLSIDSNFVDQQKSRERQENGPISSNIEAHDNVLPSVDDTLTEPTNSVILRNTTKGREKSDNKTRAQQRQILTYSSHKSPKGTKHNKQRTSTVDASSSNISKKKEQGVSVSKRLTRSKVDKMVVSEKAVPGVPPKKSTEDVHQSPLPEITETLKPESKRGKPNKRTSGDSEPPSNSRANAKAKPSKRKRKTIITQQTSNFLETRPKRQRKPVRHHTDIIVTDAMKIISRRGYKRKPRISDKSSHINGANLEKDNDGNANISTVQQEAPEAVSLPIEQDTVVGEKGETKNKKKAGKKKKAPEDNQTSDTPVINDKQHESATLSNTRHDQVEKELPSELNNSGQEVPGWRNSTESIEQGEKVDAKNKKKRSRRKKALENNRTSDTPIINDKQHESATLSNTRHDQVEKELPSELSNSGQEVPGWRNSTESIAQGEKVDAKNKKKNSRRKKALEDNRTSDTPIINDKQHESATLSNTRHDQIEMELPSELSNSGQEIPGWRNSTETIAQDNLMLTNHTDLMTSEIMPPPKSHNTVSATKKSVSNTKPASQIDSSLNGVRNGYVTKSDKKKNIARATTDRITRAMENLPITSSQYDSTVTSQSNTLNQSTRLTGAELLNDDYITYMSNDTLCSIKYLNRTPSESDFQRYQNLYVKESMKNPSGNFSSGYLKLNPEDQKRPSIATKYSFFYNIVSGSACIQLHNKTNMVYQGDFFFVPLGIEYSIRNIDKESPLILHYVKVKGN